MPAKPAYRVEIKGVQFRNKGAYLMRLGCLDGLKPLHNMQLVLSPSPNLPYIERAQLGAWQKLSFRRKSFDLTHWIGRLPSSFQRLFHRYGMLTEQQVDAVLEARLLFVRDAVSRQHLESCLSPLPGTPSRRHVIGTNRSIE